MSSSGSMGRRSLSMDINEAHALLDRVDRDQRRQSTLSLITIIVMATALLAVWIVASARTGFPAARLVIVVVLYLVLVIVFARSAVRRQRRLAALRREAASQLGIIAARETMDLILGKSSRSEAERRRVQRVHCDQPLTVTAGDATYYGRVCDLSEGGMGAIVPAALELGAQLAVEFPLGSQTVHLQATVRQRNGVRYGFDFAELTQDDRGAIEKFRATAQPASEGAKSAGAEGA